MLKEIFCMQIKKMLYQRIYEEFSKSIVLLIFLHIHHINRLYCCHVRHMALTQTDLVGLLLFGIEIKMCVTGKFHISENKI